eukprot:5319349-Prymnesium_polylepis.1
MSLSAPKSTGARELNTGSRSCRPSRPGFPSYQFIEQCFPETTSSKYALAGCRVFASSRIVSQHACPGVIRAHPRTDHIRRKMWRGSRSMALHLAESSLPGHRSYGGGGGGPDGGGIRGGGGGLAGGGGGIGGAGGDGGVSMGTRNLSVVSWPKLTAATAPPSISVMSTLWHPCLMTAASSKSCARMSKHSGPVTPLIGAHTWTPGVFGCSKAFATQPLRPLTCIRRWS